MSGRVSAVWSIFAALSGVTTFCAGGKFSDLLEGRIRRLAALACFFAGSGVLTRSVRYYAPWRPKAVFYDQCPPRTRRRPMPARRPNQAGEALADLSGAGDLAVLEFRSWRQTPLQFHLQNELHAPDRVLGRMERHFRRLLYPDLPALWLYLPAFQLRTLCLRHGFRGSAIRATSVRDLGDGRD